MPTERDIAEQAFSWADHTLLSFIAMVLMGTIARVFISNEPLDKRKLTGEMILAVLGAILLYSFGLLQGLTTPQMIFLGSLGSLGGVRLLEWLIKIARQVRDST